MVVSRRDAELVAVMLLFPLIVALRVATLLSGHAAAQITRLGQRLQRLAADRGGEPLPETGPGELAELAIAANTMARDLGAWTAPAVSWWRPCRTTCAPRSRPSACWWTRSPTASSPPRRRSPSTRRGSRAPAHLRELVDDLFELARLDAGDVAWEPVPVGVAELVEGTAEAMPAVRAGAARDAHRAGRRGRAGRRREP